MLQLYLGTKHIFGTYPAHSFLLSQVRYKQQYGCSIFKDGNEIILSSQNAESVHLIPKTISFKLEKPPQRIESIYVKSDTE